MPRLVLVRHGQSLWNLQNRFTGWVDVPLTAEGEPRRVVPGSVSADSGSTSPTHQRSRGPRRRSV